MTIHVEVNDINGQPLALGDEVVAYALEYAEVSRDESWGIPVIEVDSSRPKPLRDVPLFRGRIVWDAGRLDLEVEILETLEMFVEWETKPSRVRMAGYLYERIHP